MRRTVFERDPQIWAGTICRIAGPEQVDTLVAETEWPKHLERPFPDADEVLTRLASRYKVGVIANQSAGTWDRLQACGWGRLLSVCISSTEENLKKPDPRIYQLALDRAGCAAADAVMIGDRLDNDVRPAKSLGMGTVRIRQGLFAEIRPRDDAETPDAEVDSLTGLIDLFGV
jgi:putative hydrolase of the HAD superfamily